MAWNGAGNYQRTNGSFSGSEVWQDDSSAGYDIVDARHDSHDQDLAQGINNCLTKDGQNSPTANLSMNSFKHTNVGDGTARNQYATVGQLQDQGVQALSLVGGTTTTVTASMTPVISSYVTGARYYFKAVNTNTGSTTLKIDSAPAVTIQLNGSALTGGEIVTGRYFTVIYDGTNFQLLNPATSGTVRTVPATVAQVQDGDFIWLGTTAGTATAQTASAAPAITAYKAGQKFRMIVGTGLGSTGASATAHTININTVGAKNIVNNEDSSNPTLGTWVEGAIMELVYDGTNFRITNSPTGWLDLTPTVTADTGTIGTVTGTYKYRKVGRVVYLHSTLTFTHSGTVTAFLLINYPVAPLASTGQAVHAQLATPASSAVVIPCSFYTTTTSGGRFAIRLANLGTITGACTLSISGYYASV